VSLLLDVRGLNIAIEKNGRHFPLIRDFNLSLATGERLALVGESGCGKSMIALAIMGLLDRNSVKVQSGQILLRGQDLLRLGERDMRTVRGRQVSIIFQEPMTALNPIMPVGRQVAEMIRAHSDTSRADAEKEAIHLIKRVGIRDPEHSAARYPHEFSGGMRQRIVIALAIACKPQLLIADEPTTALDVTVQAQILKLLEELHGEMEMSLLLISHNLALVSSFSERIAVMYAGDIVEQGPTRRVLGYSRHPYTTGLLRCLPPLAPASDPAQRRVLAEIPGQVPTVDKLLTGCRFYDRCSQHEDRCRSERPELAADEDGSSRRCIH